MPDAKPAHKRILLKLSGEALMGDDAFGINRATIVRMVEEVSGKKVPLEVGGRREGDPPVLVASAERAERLLGWKAERDLRRIVQDAHAWLTRSARSAST